jgi:FkbM family methyltransferase
MNDHLLPLIQNKITQSESQRCVAIDVGSHHGKFSEYLVRSNLFHSVIAFEPNPSSFAQTNQLVASRANCHFHAENVALTIDEGSQDFYCNADTATASLLQYNQDQSLSGQVTKQKVATISLDGYLRNSPGLGDIVFLKIDTQGNDLNVILGGHDMILSHRPVVQVEFIYISLYADQCTPDQLIEKFKSLDYKIFSLTNLHITAEGQLAFCDAIFVPQELTIPITQTFTCIDNLNSYVSQIETLTNICAERLKLIESLDSEVKKLRSIAGCPQSKKSIVKRLQSWVR